MIQDLDQPYDMLKLLKDAYSSNQTSNRLRLNREFNSFSIGDDQIVHAMNRLKELDRQLSECGCKKTDIELVNAVLLGLPNEYKVYQTVWKQYSSMTFQKLIVECRNASQTKSCQ